ncbi:MAG: PKD domain-containing protein [Spirosomataceae bacterium]
MKNFTAPIGRIIVLFWCALNSVFAQNTTTSQEANQNGYFLKKVVSNSAIPTGVGFTYTIFYTIPGGSPAVTITDVVPSPLVVDNVIATAVCGTPTVTQTTVVGGTQVSYALPATTTSCSGSFQINVHFPAGTTCNGEVARNRACMEGASGGQFCTGFVSTTAQASDPWHVYKNPSGASYIGGTCPWGVVSDTVEYIISVYKNVGLYGFLNLENVKVVDRMPVGAVFVSGTPILPATGTITASGTDITWTGLGMMDATQSFFQRQAKIKIYYPGFAASTTRLNKAVLTGDLGKPTQPNCGKHADSLEICVKKMAPVTSGQISKYAFVSGNAVGCAGYYWITVCNNGTTPLTNFNVYDNIPTGITVTSIDVYGTVANPVTLNVNSSNVISSATSTQTYTATLGPNPSIYFQNNGSLAVGSCVYYKINFTINASAPSTINNCADLKYPMPSPTTTQTSCSSIAIYPPAPKVCAYKEVCNKQTSYSQNQIVRYRLRVQNIGTGVLSGANITDLLNSNLQYIGNETYYTGSAYSPPCGTSSTIPSGTATWPGVSTAHVGNALQWNLPNIGVNCSNIYYPNCGQYGTAGVPFYFIEFDAKIRDTSAVGVIPNLFTVQGGNLTAVSTSNTEYITVNAVFGFTLDKKVSKDNGVTFAPSVTTTAGSNVVYRLGFTKTGAALKNLLFIDMLPRDNVANDYLMLNRPISRGSQFDVLHQNFVASNALPAVSSYANAVNLCLPELAYSPGGCNFTTWLGAALNARNVKANFGSSFMPIATQTYDFKALVSGSALPNQKACNTFAARAAAMMIINSVNTAVALTASESNQACITVESVQNCCEKAQIIQTEKPCCSRLRVDCPVKQIKVTLSNGTFTNLAWTCAPAPSGYVGLSTYTLVPSGVCNAATVEACFKATGPGGVTVTYVITFADGTVCEKKETKKCCCDPVIQVPQTACAGLPFTVRVIDTQCPVKNILWNFGDGGTSAAANPSHIYTNPGTYTITLTYENECGKQTVTFTIVVEKCPCKVNPCIAYAANGLQVLFSAAGSTSTPYPIVAYHWDFGDGTWGTGAIPPIHTYAAAGTYTVCVTVYADNGNGPCECFAKICREIKIAPGAQSGSTCNQQQPNPNQNNGARIGEDKVPDTNGENEMKVMPNPFTNSMRVKIPTLKEGKMVDKLLLELTTLQGQVVKTVTIGAESSEAEISTQDLPSGVYVLSYKQDGKLHSAVKVVKD